MIPYGRHWLDDDDIEAVVSALRSDWLTTGPKVCEFEAAFAREVGSSQSVAVSSGTAGLHCAMVAANIQPQDEVIVPTMTFAATANCVLYQGARPVFADVDPATLLIDPEDVARKVTSRTKAVIAVDFAGQACDYDALNEIATGHNLTLVADACHSLGGRYRSRFVGNLAALNVFSMHPVKHITTGEGGVVTTNDETMAQRMRRFRNHGINKDLHQRQSECSWHYEVADLGFNYRISDFQCALGLTQLKKLPRWIARRREIAKRYDAAFSQHASICPLVTEDDRVHAYHLYVVRVVGSSGVSRHQLFELLRHQGIGVNVHYIPLHTQPLYVRRLGTFHGLCPVAEAAYEEILSLPIFPKMSDDDVEQVVHCVKSALADLLKSAA